MSLTFCKDDHRYTGGDSMRCNWRLHFPTLRAGGENASSPEAMPPNLVQGIEVSVMWYTEGKGDEDFNVHFFQRFGAMEVATIDWDVERTLTTELPISPLSYEGTLLRIRWCVRLRLFMSNGSEVVAQHPFWLVAPTAEH